MPTGMKGRLSSRRGHRSALLALRVADDEPVRAGGGGFAAAASAAARRSRTGRNRSRPSPTCGQSALRPAPQRRQRVADLRRERLAGASRSLRVSASHSMTRGSRRPGGQRRQAGIVARRQRLEHLRRRDRHAGIDQHQMQCREVGEHVDPLADAPRRSAAVPARHIGRSAPSAEADPARSPSDIASSQSALSARSVAAASLDPPPMPDATGRFFSSWIETGAAWLIRKARRAACRARQGPDCRRRAARQRRTAP